MTSYYLYAYASEGERSGKQEGSKARIHIRTGLLLNTRGYENLRRNTVRSRTVFQVWGKPRKEGRKSDEGLQLSVMLQIYDLKTIIRNERHVLVLDSIESANGGEIISEEKRVLSPHETYRWLKKHHRSEFADVLFPGKRKHLSRKRINFNSLFFNFIVSPSRIVESLLNILVIALILLLIPLIIFIVSISLEMDYLGALERYVPVRQVSVTDIYQIPTSV